MTALESLSSRLPPVFCPIAPAIHANVEDVESEAVAWIDRTHLYATARERAWMIGSNSAEWCARLMPDGVQERLQILAEWTYWGFFFDDQRCDSEPYCNRPGHLAELAGKLVRSLEGPPRRLPAATDPFIVALQDLHARFWDLASPVQLRRWIDGHRHWLSSVVWQNSYNERGVIASLDEYLTFRGPATAGPVVVGASDFVDGYELPERDCQDPAVRALTEMTCVIGGIDNDLQSWSKERRLQHSGQNIISVLAHQYGSTPESALATAVALRNDIMDLFLTLTEQTAARAGAELRRYLAGLGHTIRGNLDWGRAVPRYTADDDQEANPVIQRHREQMLSTAFTRTTEAPRLSELSSIAWWCAQARAGQSSLRLPNQVPGRL
jgi:Terpene synthase family 2, C-terminal metal binding